MDDKINTPSYIARCKCGCGGTIMATVDVPERKRETAKEIAKCIRDGYAIERVTVGYVRSNPFGCQKEAKQEQLF